MWEPELPKAHSTFAGAAHSAFAGRSRSCPQPAVLLQVGLELPRAILNRAEEQQEQVTVYYNNQ